MTHTWVDRFGKSLTVGAKVVYTTNARGSGLGYGLVEDLYLSHSFGYAYQKVKVRILNDDGTDATVFQTHVPPGGTYKNAVRINTGKHLRASVLDYSPGKFLVLE